MLNPFFEFRTRCQFFSKFGNYLLNNIYDWYSWRNPVSQLLGGGQV